MVSATAAIPIALTRHSRRRRVRCDVGRSRSAAVLGRSKVASSERVASSPTFNLPPPAVRPRGATFRSLQRGYLPDSVHLRAPSLCSVPSRSAAANPLGARPSSAAQAYSFPNALPILLNPASQPLYCPVPKGTPSCITKLYNYLTKLQPRVTLRSMKNREAHPANRGAVGMNLATLAKSRPVSVGFSASCTFLVPLPKRLATRPSPLADWSVTSVPSQTSNLKCQIPFGPSAFCLSKDPSLIPKCPSFIPEYPPSSRNIPPYPRISPPSFSFATNSSTVTSIATPRTSSKPLP